LELVLGTSLLLDDGTEIDGIGGDTSKLVKDVAGGNIIMTQAKSIVMVDGDGDDGDDDNGDDMNDFFVLFGECLNHRLLLTVASSLVAALDKPLSVHVYSVQGILIVTLQLSIITGTEEINSTDYYLMSCPYEYSYSVPAVVRNCNLVQSAERRSLKSATVLYYCSSSRVLQFNKI
jgi:hypothetical protein